MVAGPVTSLTLLADNLTVKSKIHPKYKTKYHVGNWPAYERALVRRGGRRGWKNLHLGVDRFGVIRAQALTESTVDDATTRSRLVETVAEEVARVTADAAYDTVAFYTAAGARGATVVVSPAKTASVSRRGLRFSARDRTIKRVKKLGSRRWKKEAGCHQQARVESAFFRYRSIISTGLRARTAAGRQTEALLVCNVLNRMTERGRPLSYSIGR